MKTMLVWFVLGTIAFSQPWKPLGSALDKHGATSLQPPAQGSVIIHGRVIQRTDSGLLIKTTRRGDDGLVWLRGHDAKQGQTVSVPAIKGDAEAYTTILGAAKMLDGYDARK